jgi:hypothetical protein
MTIRRLATIFAAFALLALSGCQCGSKAQAPSAPASPAGVWDQMSWDQKNWQ